MTKPKADYSYSDDEIDRLSDDQVRLGVVENFNAGQIVEARRWVSEAEYRGIVRQYNCPLNRIFDEEGKPWKPSATPSS